MNERLTLGAMWMVSLLFVSREQRFRPDKSSNFAQGWRAWRAYSAWWRPLWIHWWVNLWVFSMSNHIAVNDKWIITVLYLLHWNVGCGHTCLFALQWLTFIRMRQTGNASVFCKVAHGMRRMLLRSEVPVWWTLTCIMWRRATRKIRHSVTFLSSARDSLQIFTCWSCNVTEALPCGYCRFFHKFLCEKQATHNLFSPANFYYFKQ